MARKETLAQILSTGAVAVIRMKDARRLSKVVEAIRVGGVKCIEITMTVPGAVEIIAEMARSRVLFPAPFGPTTPTISFSSMFRLKPFRAIAFP